MSALYNKILREAAEGHSTGDARRKRGREPNGGLPSRAPDRVSNRPVHPACQPDRWAALEVALAEVNAGLAAKGAPAIGMGGAHSARAALPYPPQFGAWHSWPALLQLISANRKLGRLPEYVEACTTHHNPKGHP